MSGRGILVLRLLLALALAPLVSGRWIVTYQDAVMTHLPTKAATVELVRGGELPVLNPYASFGQPLAGNPNFGTFFPDMLLFLTLPLTVAFGCRFALAAALAFVGARRWARAEGASRGSAEVAAWAFVLSGVFVSAWRFFNTALALGLAPWVMAAAARLASRAAVPEAKVRRAAAELALWAGLEVLAGEPVVALLVFLMGAVRAVVSAPARAYKRAFAWTALGFLLAGALAAPQIAATMQVYPTSTRSLAPFPYGLATSASVDVARLLELVIPFPFGRPDLTGGGGFTGHEHHDNHAPYLWTLQVGWTLIALLLLFSRPSRREERRWWLAVVLGIILSFGHGLPGAKLLHPILSLGGRVRFPVKWWYVVALVLVPLAAMAADQWAAGTVASRGRRLAVLLFAMGAMAMSGRTTLAMLGAGASLAAAGVLSSKAARASQRSLVLLAVLVIVPLGLGDLPLLRAFVDRPPDPPPRFEGGRVYETLRVEAHPAVHSPAAAPPEQLTREVFRRASRELWALTGALNGMAYAFDHDPDGAYFEGDRVVGKSVDSLPWAERAPALRLAGVSYVVADVALPAPFAPLAILGPAHGVTLYHLDGAAPSIRVATRTFPALKSGDVAAVQNRPDFDPATDAVVLADRDSAIEGEPRPAAARIVEERASGLRAQVDAPAPALLVWSRTWFPAWTATVDGAAAPIVVADGHLVGVRVPAGSHAVQVRWSVTPIVRGAVLAAIALVAIGLLRR